MRKASIFLTAALFAGIASAGHAQDSAFRPATDGSSTLVHVESGTKFPLTVAGFERTGEAAFDGRGDYVSVGYRSTLPDGLPVTLRLAVAHVAQMTPREHFIIAKPMVLDGLSDVKTVVERAYQRPDNKADGYIGIYDARDGDRKIGVGLWTFERGYWDLRGRVEFPHGKRKQAQAAVDGFVDAFVALAQPYSEPKR